MKTSDGSPVGQAVNDFARGKVDESATHSGLHLALIIIGGTIGFAIFIVASQIGGSLGYARAGLAFVVGSLVLGSMGAITSYVGARSRFSTYLLTQFAFGRKGAQLANLAVAISLIGWYGVISNFLGQAGQQMLLDLLGLNVSPYLTVLVASTLMVGVTAAGFTGIDKLALWLVPVMVFFLIYAAWASLTSSSGQGNILENNLYTFETAVSAVVGSYIAGVIIQPDYSRFATNTRQATWAVLIALGLVFPVIQYLSAIPSMATGEPDLLAVMKALGLLLPAFLLLFLGAWSSNVLCLYSAGLSVATLLTNARLAVIVISLGVIGTAIAFVPAQTYLIDFLVLLGIAIPPIGAIYICEAIFIRKFDMDTNELSAEPGVSWPAMISWFAAIGVGYMSESGVFGLIHIGSIDSLITSTVVYLVLKRLFPKALVSTT